MFSASPVSQSPWPAGRRSQYWLSPLLPALLLALPAAAWADIYKWTDESGQTVYSNSRPAKSVKAKDVEVVMQDAKPAAIPDRAATRTEQALLARIESLERQLDARQYAAQAPAPAPVPYTEYYPPMSPPTSYYTGGYPWSYSGYYPAYSYPFVSSYVVYPRRGFTGRPVHVEPHGGSLHGRGGHAGGGHRGR